MPVIGRITSRQRALRMGAEEPLRREVEIEPGVEALEQQLEGADRGLRTEAEPVDGEPYSERQVVRMFDVPALAGVGRLARDAEHVEHALDRRRCGPHQDAAGEQLFRASN